MPAAERVSGSGHDERLPEPESRDEIHALAVTLNSMLDRLAAARDREHSFVANVAHELRSPLASLRVQVDVAERHGAHRGGPGRPRSPSSTGSRRWSRTCSSWPGSTPESRCPRPDPPAAAVGGAAGVRRPSEPPVVDVGRGRRR